jgi:DNA-binding response OmpR family regulator
MRILLAEDERSMSRAIEALLTSHNYSVDTVFDGEKALLYLRSGDYDAAILDIMMPKIDGISVLRTIRKNGMRLPVLLLTAKSEIDDKVEGLDSGANDYLTKPFNCKELLARLRAMTRSKAAYADKLLKFGNVTLDRDSCTITGPSDSVRLSGKEYQMMELLMRDPDRVISVEKFMNKVWGIDSDAEINVVWTFLSYLRKKLQLIGADIIIKASRGQGYHLEARGHDQ